MMAKKIPYATSASALRKAGQKLVDGLDRKSAMRLRWYLSNCTRQQINELAEAMLDHMAETTDWEAEQRRHRISEKERERGRN